MNLVLSMWSVWGLLVLVYLALRIYVARLNRDEDDTIILDDAAFGQEKAEQARYYRQGTKDSAGAARCA